MVKIPPMPPENGWGTFDVSILEGILFDSQSAQLNSLSTDSVVCWCPLHTNDSLTRSSYYLSNSIYLVLLVKQVLPLSPNIFLFDIDALRP